ncbi:MAG: ketose-bisphosphate aldolase [Proteobacteria bacterium]|nr:ketose-bisphosphate aldolase [Pseudomonadota bacterium]NBY49074.1 ketose-bisphosphate aldolase [Pseudomonadota bacterium]
MSLVPMKQILDEAERGGYGVGAFNVNNMEQIQGIVRAARETNSPVIIQASKGALRYTNLIYLKKLMEAAVEENPNLKIALHLDHGNDLDVIRTAIDLGFTSVMLDGSLEPDGKTPRSFESNVDITRRAVEMAHPHGVTVEGELGTLGGIEEHVQASRVILTDPEEAAIFVERTGVDALAVAIGTSHGAYKFKDTPTLAIDLVEKIHALVPDVRIVMHGSSSVPAELIDAINRYGGQMPNARGVPVEAIQEGIRHGVRKINVDTDTRLAATATIRRIFHDSPTVFDPRDYLGPVRDAITAVVKERMIAFGSAGHNDDYVPTTLDAMKQVYAARR